jgi:hypothetical protein
VPGSSDEQQTPHFFPVPSVMIVGLSLVGQALVLEVFGSMLVLRVGHVAAACERMVKTRPLVVVCETPPKESELEVLRTTVLDISARLVILSEHHGREARVEALLAAKRDAIATRNEYQM